MFAERRRTVDGASIACTLARDSSAGVTSPIGWDRSYPLKPVSAALPNAPIYRRNVPVPSGVNKYSGNYGPKRSASQNRGVSLDRSAAVARRRCYDADPESGYSSGAAATMGRTRSHHQLGNSSGDDSYGSRSPSRGGGGGNGVNGGGGTSYGRYGGANFAHTGRITVNYNDDEDEVDMGLPKTAYTREYVQNLPPTTNVSASNRGRLSRTPRINQRESSPSGRSSYEHSSYSSQSSEKSDPPQQPHVPFSVAPSMSSSRSHGRLYNGRTKPLTPSSTEENLARYSRSNSRSKINTKTYR